MMNQLVLIPIFLTTLFLVRHKRNTSTTKKDKTKGSLSRLIFLGSGCSGGTPISLCLLGLVPGRPSSGCQVCQSAHGNENHVNHRRNPSVLIQNPNRNFNCLIDCGKTFREAALQWFPKFDVKGISCIILTHEHADALFGLDEIRMVQKVSVNSELGKNPPERVSSKAFSVSQHKDVFDIVQKAKSDTLTPLDNEIQNATTKQHPLGSMYDQVIVHCMARTKKFIETSFPYLVSKGVGTVPRFVSQLELSEFPLDVNSSFEIQRFFNNEKSLKVIPLPVDHGQDYLCAGFQFGKNDVVVYISDVSKIPTKTMDHLNTIPEIRLFVVDCLRPINREKHLRPQVHFDLEDALSCIRNFRKPPKETLFTGLGHEFDHDETNAMLQTLPKDIFGIVRCAHDGLCLELDL